MEFCNSISLFSRLKLKCVVAHASFAFREGEARRPSTPVKRTERRTQATNCAQTQKGSKPHSRLRLTAALICLACRHSVSIPFVQPVQCMLELRSYSGTLGKTVLTRDSQRVVPTHFSLHAGVIHPLPGFAYLFQQSRISQVPRRSNGGATRRVSRRSRHPVPRCHVFLRKALCKDSLLTDERCPRTSPDWNWTRTRRDETSRTLHVTTPIYYVNGEPHLGHLYSSLFCDVTSRFYRLDGVDVLFSTGTDEHGQKIEAAAAAAGFAEASTGAARDSQFRSRLPKVSEQEILKFVHEKALAFLQMSQDFNIKPDNFVRTSRDSRHSQVVRRLWSMLRDRNQIYKGMYSGWYSPADEAFYEDRQLIRKNGELLAPTGSSVTRIMKEESYFFRLSEWTDSLQRLYRDKPDMLQPPSRRKEVFKLLDEGLKDVSISRPRDSVSWGIAVPGDGGHTIFVWFDALVNYLTSSGYLKVDNSAFLKLWSSTLHVVGKDILRFHAILWPAMLLAAGIPPPARIFAHGWWRSADGEKMSKSRGNALSLDSLFSVCSDIDVIRFHLLHEMKLSSDTSFSSERLKGTSRRLANEIGNLAHRALSFVFSRYRAIVPTKATVFSEEDLNILAEADKLLPQLRLSMATQDLNRYTSVILHLAEKANQYFQRRAPWKIISEGSVTNEPDKSSFNRGSLERDTFGRGGAVLFTILEVVRRIAVAAHPVMPTSSQKLLDQLNVESSERTMASVEPSMRMKGGQKISKPYPVFCYV